MARFFVDDGYTLTAFTEPTVVSDAGKLLASDLPILTFQYRPALPDAIYSWRYDLNRAASGRAELDATAKFLHLHLVSWDRVDRHDKLVTITPETIRTLPEPILNQVLNCVITWKPQKKDAPPTTDPKTSSEDAENLSTG